MPVTRGRARAVNSASATPSATVSPMFSARASARSTPDTSVDEDGTVLKQEVRVKTKKSTITRKRVREDSSEDERKGLVNKRGAKRRAVQQSAYVEVATRQTTLATKVTSVLPCFHQPPPTQSFIRLLRRLLPQPDLGVLVEHPLLHPSSSFPTRSCRSNRTTAGPSLTLTSIITPTSQMI